MQPITITNVAVNHIKSMLAKKPNALGFRLSVKKTGCSGFAYVPTLIEKIVPEDVHVLADPDVHIYMDSLWLNFLEGITIDYVTNEQDGIKQQRLVYTNPQEKQRCGCGESFTIE